MPHIHLPPRLSPGDRIAVVAPSSFLPRGRFLAGLAWLRDRYRVEFSSDVFARRGYLAGDDSQRLEVMSHAMRDEGVRAIVAGRGGYGATRIVSRLPWDEWARRPSWIVGFSDVTAMHIEAQARGVATLHAPNVTGLGSGRPCDRLRFMRGLEGGAMNPWRLTALRPGDTSGALTGGNLMLLTTQAASGKLTNSEGSIVLLEDVTEKPYQIDRMLNALLERGFFARAAAVVFGEFAQCPAGPDGVTVSDVIAEFATRVSCPVFEGAPFGHGERNEAVIMGQNVRLASSVLHF